MDRQESSSSSLNPVSYVHRYLLILHINTCPYCFLIYSPLCITSNWMELAQLLTIPSFFVPPAPFLSLFFFIFLTRGGGVIENRKNIRGIQTSIASYQHPIIDDCLWRSPNLCITWGCELDCFYLLAYKFQILNHSKSICWYWTEMSGLGIAVYLISCSFKSRLVLEKVYGVLWRRISFHLCLASGLIGLKHNQRSHQKSSKNWMFVWQEVWRW